MILIVCILGIGVGLLTGGRFQSILHKHFRMKPVLVLSLVCELLLASPAIDDWLRQLNYYPTIRVSAVIVQYGLIILFLAVNRMKPGFLLVMAGSLMNALVMIANGGQMPIGRAILTFGEQAAAKIDLSPHYFLASGAEPLLFLGDIIPCWIYMISVGDIVISLGLFIFGIYLPKKITRQRTLPDHR